jgi:hypothetical protein
MLTGGGGGGGGDGDIGAAPRGLVCDALAQAQNPRERQGRSRQYVCTPSTKDNLHH